MKYSILGFNQECVLNYENLDTDDLLLLGYVYDAIASPSMSHIIENDICFVWLSHSKIHEDLPILHISEDRLKRRIKKLVDLNLLQTKRIYTGCTQGSKSYYAITKECEDLRFSSVKNNTSSEKQVLKTTLKNQILSVENNTSDNKLISNSKLKKDSSINTTVGFLGSNKKQPKQNLYSKLTALIDGFTDNLKIRQALREFLNLQLEIYKDEGKTFYVNVWKNRLNKLKNEFKEDEWLAVIQYATSKGWQNFYSIPTYDNYDNRKSRYDVRKGKAWEENVVSAKMTDAERQADEEEADRLEAMGIRARF